MELKEIIASRIKELRVINGLSQVQIAKELGTTQASVARYERGEIFPKEVHVLWYADRFNVSLDWIFVCIYCLQYLPTNHFHLWNHAL